ncbi:hypothetical protein ACIBI9_20635 [Nonomuraea sp. NPDC050451]
MHLLEARRLLSGQVVLGGGGHHLYRAYPKLGVNSRRELAGLVLTDG